MTTLRFMGEWSVWTGLAVAAAAGFAAAWLYRLQLKGRSGPAVRLLPWLRAAAVFLAVMMLAGPVLHHRKRVGDLLRLRVVVDASASSDRTDPEMEPSRKLQIARALGWISREPDGDALVKAAGDLARAAESAARAESAAAGADPAALAADFKKAVESAADRLRNLASDALKPTVRPGSIFCEIWKNMPGKTVESLVRNPAFAGPPAEKVFLNPFTTSGRNDDNVGMRVTGYLLPPATGDYILWVCSDDASELRVGTDETPGSRRLVASVNDWVPKDNWETQPNQKSAPLRLEAGKRYSVEVLYKEEVGDDYLSVGWTRPDGQVQRPIPGEFLSPPEGAETGGPADGWRRDFEQSFRDPARTLDAGDLAKNRSEFIRRLGDLGRKAAAWEALVREEADRVAAARIAADESLRAVSARLDKTTRWQRMQSLLLEGPTPILARLAEKHDVELLRLDGRRLEPVWNARAGRHDDAAELPPSLGAAPAARSTDLAAAMPAESRAGAGANEGVRQAVLLLTDGAHNEGDPPVHAARVLGARGIPVFTAGFGTVRPPCDVSVLGVDAPRTVFHKDRLKGSIALNDSAPAGRPFKLRLRAGAETIWERELVTENGRRREVPFDIPVEGLVSNLLAKEQASLQRSGIPMELSAVIDAPEGDIEPRNNERPFNAYVTLRKNRLLLIDGRPRWEWRYLRNLFDRDEQWEVTSVLPADDAFPRGEGAGRLPPTREALFGYDVLILGEFAVAMLTADEWEWVRAFSRDRGGGVILVDGPRGLMKTLAAGPLAPLVPVEWKGAEPVRMPERLELTPEGRAIAAFDLGAATNGAVAAGSRWTDLPPPHLLAPVAPLPGAETLVHAVAGERRAPVVVQRRYGAGQVCYFASDETWRWRREVADRDHQRFWNQLSLWAMEEPFAIGDGRVSIDAGAVSYRPGESASIRVRIRDEQGRIRPLAMATVLLDRDGQRAATLPMQPDENGGGVLRARTGALQEGAYEVRVRIDGEREDAVKAVARFQVQAGASAELNDYGARPELLRQVSRDSGGAFVDEEQLDQVVDALEPLVQGRVIETDTVLWQGYPWFAVIILLLTIEWVLRRRKGLL